MQISDSKQNNIRNTWFFFPFPPQTTEPILKGKITLTLQLNPSN